MCCRSEWQERMYIYKWHEVDQTKHEIFCVHIVCNEIQVKVNLEITTFFFYLHFPYCPNFFWFGVVYTVYYSLPHIKLSYGFRKYSIKVAECLSVDFMLSVCPHCCSKVEVITGTTKISCAFEVGNTVAVSRWEFLYKIQELLNSADSPVED